MCIRPLLHQAEVAAKIEANTAMEAENEGLRQVLRECRPHLQQLEEEEIGRAADLVLGLFNYEAEHRSVMAEPVITSEVTAFEVGLLKNRYGSVGSWVQLEFQGRCGLIRDPEPE